MGMGGSGGEGLFLTLPAVTSLLGGKNRHSWGKKVGSRTEKPKALSRTMAAGRGGMGVLNGYGKDLGGRGRPSRAVPIPPNPKKAPVKDASLS